MSKLKLFNTLSASIEEFTPINGNKVNMYVCGVTVYDKSHIGHARVFIVFDSFTRFLKQLGYEVNYVRNITDIDDKIINKANDMGIDINALTKQTIELFHKDCKSLNLISPNHEPKATEYVKNMVELILDLEFKGYAYKTPSGDVYFAVNKFKEYGKLSKKKLDQLKSGARIEVGDEKRDPLDFVLWKSSKENEPSWKSPWGLGRPGWHIECSAMANSLLGKTIDIHGGGTDLQFPHHENEIAQSEASNGCDFTRYWMHVGHVQVNSEKMSKSLNNFTLIQEVLKKYSADEIRLFMLMSHYRSPLDFSYDQLDQAKNALARITNAVADASSSGYSKEDFVEYDKTLREILCDDFHTPRAIAYLFDLITIANKENNNKLRYHLKIIFQDVLGLVLNSSEEELSSEIVELLQQRKIARESKDWSLSDELRERIEAYGYTVKDSSNGEQKIVK